MERFKAAQRYSPLPDGQEGSNTKVTRMASSRTGRILFVAFFSLMVMRSLYLSFRPTLHATEGVQIVPGATWTDVNTGEHVQAHGGAIYEVGNTYYWIGEDKTQGTFFQNINCYSSRDLANWSFVRALLTRQEYGDLGPSRIVERPKVIHNRKTGKWVMYTHIDNHKYEEAKVGVAESSSICGEYSYKESFRPLNFESRDIGLYQEPDGTGYLLTEDRQHGLRINKLTADYLGVESNVYLWSETIESPALIERSGRYYMFGSNLTGWLANDNMYSTATSLEGPWSEWRPFAKQESLTYHSQTTFVLKVGQTYVYMGDRWTKENLMRSTYIWLPLEFDGSSVKMEDHRSWILDTYRGLWGSPGFGMNHPPADAELFGKAKVIECLTCSPSNFTVTGIDSPDDGFNVRNANSLNDEDCVVLIHYHNPGNTSRHGIVQLNDDTPQHISYLPSCTENCPWYEVSISVMHIPMSAGINGLRISGANGAGPGPTISNVEIINKNQL